MLNRNNTFYICFLIEIFYSIIVFSNNYLNFQESTKDFYDSFIFKTKKSEQQFKIRDRIKILEQNLFIINKAEIKDFEIIKNYKLSSKEKEWKIEKMNFALLDNVEIFSAEPKFPREYYKFKVEFDESKYNYLIVIKTNNFSSKIPLNMIQFFPRRYDEINFEINYFLFADYEKEKVFKEGFEDIIYKISFIHDTTPLDSFNRKIEVFGIIDEVK